MVYDAMCGMCKAVNYDVLMLLTVKNTIFYNVMICILVEVCHLMGFCCLRYHGR